ncbi:hypothetical protein H920_02598 [Fukomys damarensis]|uniref:Uncharacterized protein n=1 Tax=Fukomys damarensis TaxID=885580 RepID=A0A091DZR7_FUKDA|nr:hypothetical protein H920_02598 [Fukomys damarensis]
MVSVEFSPAASSSVISDSNIATKKSHCWVSENQLQDRSRKLQRFQNSSAPAALQALPLVGDVGHGNKTQTGTCLSGRMEEDSAHPENATGEQRVEVGLQPRRSAYVRAAVLGAFVINQGNTVGSQSSLCLRLQCRSNSRTGTNASSRQTHTGLLGETGVVSTV